MIRWTPRRPLRRLVAHRCSSRTTSQRRRRPRMAALSPCWNRTGGFSTQSSSNDNKDPTKDATSPPPPSWWTQIRDSPPNWLSLGRLASVPVVCYWMTHDEPYWALAGCAAAAASDWLDGYLARRHPPWQTPLGTFLDPLCDKIWINALSATLWYCGNSSASGVVMVFMPGWLVGLWATRDAGLLLGTYCYLQRQPTQQSLSLTVRPTLLSKVNTTLQFATLGCALLVWSVDSTTATTTLSSLEHWSTTVLPVLWYTTGATTIGSALEYTWHAGLEPAKATTDRTKDATTPPRKD